VVRLTAVQNVVKRQQKNIMINTEKLKERLKKFQKEHEKDEVVPWEQLDEIYSNPLTRAYYEGYYDGCGNSRRDKMIYICKYKEQYQEFYDDGYKDGLEDRKSEIEMENL